MVHIPDVEDDPEYEMTGEARTIGYRSVLSVPMLRDEQAIGAITVLGGETGAFSERQVQLLQTFADQAVIAIENVRLFKELQARNSELTEALDQQTATSKILRVISSSPTDLQPVLDAVAESAARLCDANDAQIVRVEGTMLRQVASYGPLPHPPAGEQMAITRGLVTGRTVIDGQTVHVHDIIAEEDTEFPDSRVYQTRFGHRTMLATPLMREGIAIGAIVIRRIEVHPFLPKQIDLLQTFADQAVIAIENVRLFTELQDKNRALTEAHAQVTEALEQQTATSEILRVISQSPTDAQPVFDTIVASAVKLCRAEVSNVTRFDGEWVHMVAMHVDPTGADRLRHLYPARPSGASATLRAIRDHSVVHISDLDLLEDSEYEVHETSRAAGFRAVLSVPMLREGRAIGSLTVGRAAAGRFSDKQVALLRTFADQAVIAIEKVRLFNELRARTAELTRSVEKLTALGEVSRAVSSTLDVDTVLQMIVSRASQLAGADGCSIYEYDEAAEEFQVRATHNIDTKVVETLRTLPFRKGEGVMGRAAESREPTQIPDIAQPDAYQNRRRDLFMGAGYRALLSVPLLREDQVIGSLSLNRKESGEFPPEVVDVLKNFATQSALAIQNARLFREIEAKSRQLDAASRHKSEFLANMSHELRTPLNAIIGFSEVLAERMFGEVNEKQAEYLQDILASGRHLLSLINDILDLSKVEAGRLALELASFNLPVAVENALTLVRERAARHGISLAQAVDERVGDIVADERKVKQILLNLLSNAVKFTPAGGRVAVTATPSDGVIEISVSDTGIGIAPEDQAAIFEEFRQVGTSDAQRPEGTGLGLTLAKKFVELHGGQIWVRSHVGQGSTFTFTLPVRPESTSTSE